jgi:hypothetical protein
MADTDTALGAPAERREGRDKVTGLARYAAEHTVSGRVHAWPVAAAVARGSVRAIDTSRALRLPEVLTVLTHENAPRLADPDDPTLAVLQNSRVPHRGWPVALVVAETLEAARSGAAAVRVEYTAQDHDVTLTENHPGAYVPEEANGGYPAQREQGDPEDAFTSAAVRLDTDYRVPPLHNHPMEPHAATAHWDNGRLIVHDSSQGTTVVRATLAALFRLPEDRVTVRVLPLLGFPRRSGGGWVRLLCTDGPDVPAKPRPSRRPCTAGGGAYSPGSERDGPPAGLFVRLEWRLPRYVCSESLSATSSRLSTPSRGRPGPGCHSRTLVSLAVDVIRYRVRVNTSVHPPQTSSKIANRLELR